MRVSLLAMILVPALALAQAPTPATPEAPKQAPAKPEAAKPKQKGKAGAAAKASAAGTQWMKAAREGQDLFATLRTTQGDIVVRLFAKDAPKTVENFVGLASGEKEWVHPASGEKQKKPLYDGLVFHRVIPNFMIQGGDPLGQGFGGPGYKFEDEFTGTRKFDKPGILAMANSGPNTNGSQFFITVAPTPHLNNRHTIFGEVVSGYENVEKIANVPKDRMDKPQTPVVIKTIELSQRGPGAAAAPTSGTTASPAKTDKKQPAKTDAGVQKQGGAQ